MSVTCQVTQLTADKIRLYAPSITTEPETGQFLTQFLLALPGVTGVEIRPASGSVVILHDGASRARILQALRGSDASATALPNAASTNAAVADSAVVASAVAKTAQPAQVPVQADALSFARCAVAHAMRGRVRLHLPVLRTQATLAGVLGDFLRQQPGVRQVRVNRRAANVVVDYDPAVMDAKMILTLVATYDPQPAEIARWQATQAAQTATPAPQRRRRTIEAGLAATALALSLFVGAPAMLLVYALLLASAGSMLQRSYKAGFKARRAKVEALTAAAMLLLGVFGMVAFAALAPLLLFGAPWVRSRLQTWPAWTAAASRAAAGHTAAPRSATARPSAPVTASASAANKATNEPMPVADVMRNDAMPAPARPVVGEPIELGLTFTGVGSLAGASSYSDGSAWVAQTTALRPVRKANG